MNKKILLLLISLIIFTTGAYYLMPLFVSDLPKITNNLPNNQVNTHAIPLPTKLQTPKLFETLRFWWRYNAKADQKNLKLTKMLNESNYDLVILPLYKITNIKKNIAIDLTKNTSSQILSQIKKMPPVDSKIVGIVLTHQQWKENITELPKSYFYIIDKVTVLQLANLPINTIPLLHNPLTTEIILFKGQHVLIQKDTTCLVKKTSECIAQNWAKSELQPVEWHTNSLIECPDCKNVYQYRWLTQQPIMQSFTVKKETLPIILWKIDYPNKHITQGSYRLQYWVKEGGQERRLSSSGTAGNDNPGSWFLPRKDPQGTNFRVQLQLWYQYDQLRLTIPLTMQKEFVHLFKVPVLSSQKPLNKLQIKQMGWIPEWDILGGISSLQTSTTKWFEINPVGYIPQADGSLHNTGAATNAKLRQVAKQKGIRVVPSVALFDADTLKSILNKHLDQHVQQLLTVVDTHNFAGLDLDYESTYLDDREKLLEFVEKLATGLHKRGKILSFTAMPKWSDELIYSFLPQTHQAQDWAAIGKYVDEFRIMAYDYTSQGSLQAGPLSPIIWDEALIKYALANIPANKVVLALPLYSHSWPQRQAGIISANEQKKTYSYTHGQITSLRTLSTYKEVVDQWNGEKVATYFDDGTLWTMYYLDKSMVEKRLRLASKYGLKGVAYWRIGGERL